MRLCPCGRHSRHACALCVRCLCEWHSAGTPSEKGGAELVPVCFPACDAPWWLNPRDVTSVPVEDEDEREATKAHARRLLARGAEPEAVAAELGLSEHWVRAAARRSP